MSDTKKCKHCQTDIPKKAKVCPNCRKKQNNPIITIAGILLLAFAFVGIAGGAEVTEPDETTNPPYITMEEYESIKPGMSYEEVVEIIGSEGTASSEVSIADTNSKLYIWYGNNGISNANVTFVNDEVIAKAQVGLD